MATAELPGQPAAPAAEWGGLPPPAVQAVCRACCPASRAVLRLVCRAWREALATQFTSLATGPGPPGRLGAGVSAAFPAVRELAIAASSARDYAHSYTLDLGGLLSGLPGLRCLSLCELHEVDDSLDALGEAGLWDVLLAALPALGPRLASLSVAGCFWNQPELFGGLSQLTRLTQLRLLHNPVEAASEVRTLAAMAQLRRLEFGLIFDGASAAADVPRALQGLGELRQLEELSLPIWRRSLGGRAHPLAPALSAALGRLTRLTSLAVDGKFSHLGVVSGLTNLRRLASAAPLSPSGWQAIAGLRQLSLLTSLTPPLDVLAAGAGHPGLDLSLLAPKAALAGLDVGVLQPEHLGSLGQFSSLRRLNLRSPGTFGSPHAQAQLLSALACLPGGLTQLTLGPLLPLGPRMLACLACHCCGLRELAAVFSHVELAQPERGASSSVPGLPIPGLEEQQPAAAAGHACSSSTSACLGRMRRLRRLELLLQQPEQAAWQAAASVQAAAVGSAVARDSPWLHLYVQELPPLLEQLVLSGPWQLRSSSSSDRAPWPGAEQGGQACAGQALQLPERPGSAGALSECVRGLELSQQGAAHLASQAGSGAGSPARVGRLKRPGSMAGLEDAAAATAAGAPGAAQQAEPDVCVLEQPPPGSEKRSRGAGACPGPAAAGAQSALPALAELRLWRCSVSLATLGELLQAAGPSLARLQLLQLQSPGGFGAAALLGLPAAWASLQELCISPGLAWGLLRCGCFGPPPAPGAREATTAGLAHMSMLRCCRLLRVSPRPPEQDGAVPAPAPGPWLDLPAPLESSSAGIASRLAALQAGLAAMPALRQLHVHWGCAVDAGDMRSLFCEAGERLLAELPRCRVAWAAPLPAAAGGPACPTT